MNRDYIYRARVEETICSRSSRKDHYRRTGSYNQTMTTMETHNGNGAVFEEENDGCEKESIFECKTNKSYIHV